jgi:hypothetical protein
VAVARVAEVAAAIERARERGRGAVRERGVLRGDQRVLHLPFEIRIVLERELVAQAERDADAVGTGGDAQPVAEIEAGREPLPAMGQAGAVSQRIGVRGRRERRDYERGLGGAHRLNRRPASKTNAHTSGTPGRSSRFSPPAASRNDSG